MLIQPDHGFETLAYRFLGCRTLVIGTAGTVWEDLDGLGRVDRIIVVNRMGLDYPDRVDAWIGNGTDAEHDIWRRQRPDRAGILYGGDLNIGGDAALYAARLAISSGASGVILAGVPLQIAAGHYRAAAPSALLTSYLAAWKAWYDAMSVARDRVRSCSGATRDLFGAPTVEWLACH